MKTKFITAEGLKSKTKKETAFTHVLGMKGSHVCSLQPSDYDNVKWLGCSVHYNSHVFQCWNDRDTHNFKLYIGEKGDEF